CLAQFKAKYKQQKQLGEGGCGSVFAGYRKADHLPVSDTHTCSCTHKHTHTPYGHNVLIKVLFVSLGTSAPVSLLDWYDLGQKLILVLERPVPCEDLFTYLEVKRVKQLLQAATELENQRIFHRDIKLENILIETGSDVPRVRLIDFGLSCFFKKRSVFQDFYGTCDHIPPEYYSHFTYSASPTTVWQVGVVLFEMFHRRERFETRKFLTKKLKINKQLSENCQDFLKMCLTKLPARRPTLEQLQLHPCSCSTPSRPWRGDLSLNCLSRGFFPSSL
uniref:non-specific serine/threonine protein kinase n=1 Tax=Seriola lalandi dorsalis TaxID=1841481 RepID=A0A3B4YH28_SERLL